MFEIGTATLKDLLVTTKDGDWGRDTPATDHIAHHVIRGTDFAAARVGDIRSVPVRYLPSRTAARRTLQANDILIETAGGTRDQSTGRTLLITRALLEEFDNPVTCASFARFLRVDTNLADPRYLFWFLQSIYLAGEMFQHQVQHTGVARFQFTSFATSRTISLIPIESQIAIAEILGVLDDKIACNLRLAQESDELASHYFELLRRATQYAPVPLAEVASTQYGVTTSALKDGTTKLLRVTDINKRPWIEWDSAPMCQVGQAELMKYRVHPGDILIARMADPGKVAHVDDCTDSGVFASYLVRLRPTNSAHSLYMYYFLRSREYQEYAESVMGGSVQRNMNARMMLGCDVRLPEDLSLNRFNESALGLRATLNSALSENRHLVTIRDMLLPELISGRIRVKDAEEKVAEVL